jgi:hypothetical protein
MKDMMPTIQKGITDYYFGEGRLHSENFTVLLHLISLSLLFLAAHYCLTLSSCFFKLSIAQLVQMDSAHNSINNGE